MKPTKPRGHKSYGSIPHLPYSRLGPGEHHIEQGQADIATKQVRDRNDLVIVQEKLDGSNVGVAKLNGKLVPLSRSGYDASTSPYKQHHAFCIYVGKNHIRFNQMLQEGERIYGEWMLVPHGTRYKLHHEPFVPFDIMEGQTRANYLEFERRCATHDFTTPRLLHMGGAMPVKNIQKMIKTSGHGAIDEVEGAVWRVERFGEVDFLTKFVRQSKEDGIYLDQDLHNVLPDEFNYLIDML